ncbi:MAG: hypothetical protein ABUL46_05970 [Chitinophaga rupis]
MKQPFLRFLKRIRQLFDFNRPRFRHLECIDLVLEDKSLLLLSWDTVHANKILVRPGKTFYRQSAGAAICTLPFGTNSVDIIIHNVWRSIKVTFPLRRIAIDQQTLGYFSQYFPAGHEVSINHIYPDFELPAIELKNLQPQISWNAKISAFNISINQHQLNVCVP